MSNHPKVIKKATYLQKQYQLRRKKMKKSKKCVRVYYVQLGFVIFIVVLTLNVWISTFYRIQTVDPNKHNIISM